MHLNDQGSTTPDGLPLEPIQPTNNVPPVVPGNIPINSASDESSPPIQAPLDNEEASNPESPAEPESPEWFMKDKFKSVDEQAKSYKELSTKMGKYWGSPQDSYSVEGMESIGIEANDPLIAGLTPALKEMGISQEGFQHLVGQYFEANKAMMAEMESRLKKTLTETDAHTYQAIDKWMTDNMTAEESAMVKNNWLMTPEDFKLFNNLRLMAAPSTNVPSAGVNPVRFESSKEVENDKIKYKKELKQGTRVQDKNHEDTLAARFRDAIARELRNKGR